MKRRTDIVAASLRMLCAMLLVSAGLAHRPATAGTMSPMGISVYVLPDGSVADLCVPGDQSRPGKVIWHGCEACRIASGTLMPEPPVEAAYIARIELPADFPSLEFVTAELRLRPGASPRGPPEFFA
jgi:hypothetical protein